MMVLILIFGLIFSWMVFLSRSGLGGCFELSMNQGAVADKFSLGCDEEERRRLFAWEKLVGECKTLLNNVIL